MAARNDITGDLIKTRVGNSDNFKKGFDGIDWSVKLEDVTPTTNQPVEPPQLDLFDEERADRIGANGNDGLHYEEIK
jgi:hypothetical protein